MTKQTEAKLNQLEKALPEGLVVDAAWLSKHGYSTSLRSQYVAAGWLEQPARRVYRRPRGTLRWEQVIVSLQTLLDYPPLIVGGRTALELQGFAHYLSPTIQEVHLYGGTPPPKWLHTLNVGVRFIYHNDKRLFRNDPNTTGLGHVRWNVRTGQTIPTDPIHSGSNGPPGPWDWPLTLSTPERAILELLDKLPERESFEHVDKLMEGLSTLSPRRLDKLLADCHSVKVKRLFFFFADRHPHAWRKRLANVDFGKGKRMLVKGGKLVQPYQITVPEDLDGLQ